MDGLAHGVHGDGGVRPNLEGAGSLMDEHGEAVGVGEAALAGLREQGAFGRVVDHVVDAGRSGQRGEIDRQGILGMEAGAGGVDEQGADGQVGGRLGRGEAVERDVAGKRRERGQQGVAVGGGAVGDVERGAAAREAFHGGTAGGAAGAEQDDGCAGNLDTEGFGHGGGEAVTVGVEAVPTVGRAAQGVDGADGAGAGVDVGDGVAGQHLVRHGEVQAMETGGMQAVEGERQVGGRHVETEVAPVAVGGVVLRHDREGGVMHGRTDGVFDRMPQHGEGGAAVGPGIEIGESVDGLHRGRSAVGAAPNVKPGCAGWIAEAGSLGHLQHVLRVGRLEVGDEAVEEGGLFGVAFGLEVIGEVAAAAAEDFAHGRGGEIGQGGGHVVGAQENKNLLGRAEDAAVEGVDEERGAVAEARDHEVAGQADGFEGEAEAAGDEQVERAERNGNAAPTGDDLVEEAVVRVGVVLDVTAVFEFVIQHAIDDAALFAGRGGFDDELAAAVGDAVEFGAAFADIEARADGAGEQEGAGFELIVERADELAEFGDRVSEVQLLKVGTGVPGEVAVGAVGDLAQEVTRGGAEVAEAVGEAAAHGRTRIVEQLTQGGLFRGTESQGRGGHGPSDNRAAGLWQENGKSREAEASALAKKSGADAHLGGAGGDGGNEVAAHAHGKGGQGDAELRGEVVAELAQVGKGALGDGGVVGERGDGHEAVDAQVSAVEGGFEQGGGVFQFGAKFGGVAAGVDLEEHGEGAVEFAGGAVEALEEFGRIDALHAVEVGGGELGFVGLQVADQFPARGRDVGGELDVGHFVDGFLHAVFADSAQAEAGGVGGGPGIVGFGDGEQLDLGGVAACLAASGRDFGENGLGPAHKGLKSWDHTVLLMGCAAISALYRWAKSFATDAN